MSTNEEYDAQIEELQNRVATLTERNNQLDATLVSVNEQLAQIQSSNATSSQISTMLETLKSTIATKDTSLSDTITANVTLSQENAKLKAQVTALTQQLVTLHEMAKPLLKRTTST